MANVLITGAARGLGRELARCFHEQQQKLFLVVRSQASADELSQEFPTAQILFSDVTSESHEYSVAEWLSENTIDIVINNAGAGSKGPTIETATTDQIRSVFETNCIGVFSTVKGALPSLKRSKHGLVLNISSRRGSLTMQAGGLAKGSGCSYSYRISKAAQNMLTLCLADDLEDDGITVAAIHPGRLLTKMASSDACLTPKESAIRICRLVLDHKLKHRSFHCVEKGELPW
jgi:NAD(P)-dependent dehydrogenase (short-subunit alcohol dehydrogenase family)